VTGERALVELRDVWRRYRLAPVGRSQTLRGTVARGRRGFAREWLWALQGVDLRLARGEVVAIVGANGAGKSTLLRLAGGVGRPDRGQVEVRGRIAALLDLGRELHPDLTGRENAQLAAVVAGLTRRQFAERFDAVLEFAGLAGFEDQPLHAYSDGMKARLAFSVLAHVDPDILLVDEVLAVGDAAFQRRSIGHIEAERERGVGVLFVSHDLGLVRTVCDRAVWLDHGRIRAVGPTTEVVEAYLASTVEPAPAGGPRTVGLVRGVELLDAWGVPTSSVRTGDALSVRWEADTTEVGGRRARVSLQLRRPGAATPSVDTSAAVTPGRRSFSVAFERLDLAPGRHEVVVAVYDDGWTTRLAEHRRELTVRGEGPEGAPLAPPHRWEALDLPPDQPAS